MWQQLIEQDAAPEPDATHIRVRGADGYWAVLDLEDALRPEVMLANSLEGRPLNALHGAPLRLVSPQQYGYKSVKHVTAISIHNRAPRRYGGAMEHPRARVAFEERHTRIAGRLLRWPYRALIIPIATIAHREELLGEDGAGPFGPEGRPMQEYVALPFAWRDDAESTERWVSRALDHTAGLPPKGRCTLSHPWGRALVLPATDCCPIGWGHVQINQDLALPRIAGNNRRVRSGRASVCSQDQRIPPAVTSQPGSLRYGSGRGGSSLAAAARRPRDSVAASFRMSHRTAAARRR